MMYAAAAEQLAALHAEQHTSRLAVAARMSAFERAREELRAAQHQEAQLAERLHAARLRTGHLHRDYEVAEAELREAAESLAETQSRCHCLESQLAAHVGCQRTALLLSSPQPPAAGRLCWMDPYSVLHTSSGKVFSYDGVVPVEDVHGEGNTFASVQEEDTEVTEDEEAEQEQQATCAAHVPLSSLLKDVVHDVLQGFSCTILNTSANDIAALHNATVFESANTSEATTSAGHQRAPCQCSPSMTVGKLSRRVLQILQHEAAQCGTRSLSVTLAIGRVVPSSSFAVAAACPPMEDILRPVIAQCRADAEATQPTPFAMGDLACVQMDAKMRTGDDGDVCEGEREAWSGAGGGGVSNNRSKSRSSASRLGAIDANARILKTALPSARGGAEPPLLLPPSATMLTGVQVRSLEEVDFWLGKAGFPSVESTEAMHRSDAQASPHVLTSKFDGHNLTEYNSALSFPCVVLFGVDAQDAGGTLHKALLRIVSDSSFRPVVPAAACTAEKTTVPVQAQMDRTLQCSSPLQGCTSLLYPFMCHALAAVVREVAQHQASLSEVEDDVDAPRMRVPRRHRSRPASANAGDEGVDLDRVAEQLGADPRRFPSAADTHDAVHCAISTCPDSVTKSCFTDASEGPSCGDAAVRRVGAEWALWGALLSPLFGGNSKALWLHSASTAPTERLNLSSVSTTHMPINSSFFWSDEEVGRWATSTSASVEVTLTLCAVFCRLVRHDAVRCAISADLDRLLREKHRGLSPR